MRGSIDQALRVLQRNLNRKGVFAILRPRARYIKPCDKRRQKHERAETRRRRAIGREEQL
jgi:ribosomal protein S21